MIFDRLLSKKRIESHSINSNYSLITADAPNSVAAESFRRIKLSLDYSSLDNSYKVIQILSATQGEGKTSTLLNIARVYAEEKKRVIRVDLDFRKPKLHRAFLVENRNGLVDVLAGKVELKNAIRHDDKLGFDILPRGTSTMFPTAVMSSEGLKKIIETLKEQYELILLDCPPCLAVTDSIISSRLADCSILIISRKVSEKQNVKQAVKILKQQNVNLIGCIFNHVDKNEMPYSYYYYGSDSKKKNADENAKTTGKGKKNILGLNYGRHS